MFARTLGNAQPTIDALVKLDSIGRQIPLQTVLHSSPLQNRLRRCAEWQ
jgi:hypothetical protein